MDKLGFFQHVRKVGARHSSVKPESFTRGLRYAFAPDTLILAPALLEPWVGRYKLDIPSPEEIILSVSIVDDQLFIEAPGTGGGMEVFAESESTFFFSKAAGRLIIERNGDSPVMELKIDQGRITTAHRVE